MTTGQTALLLAVLLLKDLLPGQLIYTRAKKKRDGTFNIDKDMRATRVVHDFSVNSPATTVQLTDDTKNSVPRSSFTDVNKLLAAARPEYQDRQASSFKTRQIDITQAILEKIY